MKKLLVLAILAASTAAVMNVNAQGRQQTPEEQAASAVTTRKAVMRLLSFNNGPINGMARGQVAFDAAVAERNALRVASLASMIVEVFGAMDTRAYDVSTTALPAVWDNSEEFAQKAEAMIQAANTFAAIAARGDQTETIAAIREFGGNCGSCHDSFRVQNN